MVQNYGKLVVFFQFVPLKPWLIVFCPNKKLYNIDY